MFKKGLTVLLLASALFSGQLLATNQGHEYLQVQDADHLLRHTADSDELRMTRGRIRRRSSRTPLLAKITQTRYTSELTVSFYALATFSAVLQG